MFLAMYLLMQTVTLTHRLSSQVDLRSALSSWICLITAELYLTLVTITRPDPEPGLLAWLHGLHSDLQDLYRLRWWSRLQAVPDCQFPTPVLLDMVLCLTPSSLSLRKQLALATPWHSVLCTQSSFCFPAP